MPVAAGAGRRRDGRPVLQWLCGGKVSVALLRAADIHRTYATRDEAKRDLFAYVEGFYNRQRLHSALDYHTPDQAERRAASVA